MPTPTYTAPPTVPTRGDPTTFSSRFAAWLNWMVVQYNELVTGTEWMAEQAEAVAESSSALAAAMLVAADAAGFVATSTSSLTVSAGTKTIHFQAAKPSLAVVPYQVAIVLASDNSIRMVGNVATVVDSDDITVTVVSSGVSGSGTYSGPWLIIAGAFLGTGATAAEMWAGTTDVASVSPQSLRLAAAFQTLTEASPITWNVATQGFNAKVTLTANRTVAAPTNLQDGVTYTFHPIQGGSGSYTLSWDSVWDFGAAGVPVLSTAVGKEDKIVAQYNGLRNKLEATFRLAS